MDAPAAIGSEQVRVIAFLAQFVCHAFGYPTMSGRSVSPLWESKSRAATCVVEAPGAIGIGRADLACYMQAELVGVERKMLMVNRRNRATGPTVARDMAPASCAR